MLCIADGFLSPLDNPLAVLVVSTKNVNSAPVAGRAYFFSRIKRLRYSNLAKDACNLALPLASCVSALNCGCELSHQTRNSFSEVRKLASLVDS